MMLKVRCALSWVFYWTGDMIWRVFDHGPRGMTGLSFDAYQWAMRAAHRLQGDGDGPWYKAGGAR